MITNPQIGQQVRCISTTPVNGLPQDLVGSMGLIVSIGEQITVQFIDGSWTNWRFFCLPEHLAPYWTSPEEEAKWEAERRAQQESLKAEQERVEDQRRRKAHADKWL